MHIFIEFGINYWCSQPVKDHFPLYRVDLVCKVWTRSNYI